LPTKSLINTPPKMLLLTSEIELSKLKEVLPKNKTDYNYRTIKTQRSSS